MSLVVIACSGFDGDAGDRCDGREGFSSESHGGDAVEVVGFGDFAGRVW
jgi:hypothetical protein